MSDVKEGADECLKGWKARRKEGRKEGGKEGGGRRKEGALGRVREWTVIVSILISTEHSHTSNHTCAGESLFH